MAVRLTPGVTERRAAIDSAVLVALGLVVVLLPFPTPLGYLPSDGDPARAFRVFLPDIPLAVVAVLAAVRVARFGPRGIPGPIVLALGMAALLLAALVLHPSPRGAELALRSTGGIALAVGLVSATRAQLALLLAVLAISAIVQAALGHAQVASGGPLGLWWLGEDQRDLYRVGGSLSPRGTTHHSNLLASLGLLAAAGCVAAAVGTRRVVPWLIAAGLVLAPVGMSYSRNALVAIAVGVAALAPAGIRGSRVHRLALVALVLGAGVPAALNGDGWGVRAQASISRFPDRPLLIAQALPIIGEHPLLGVGPGLYGDALDALERRSPGSVRVAEPPHSVPVLVAAEAGIAAGALILAAVAWAGWRALRAGDLATFAFGMFLPFVLNDLFPYSFAQGPALLGLWLGLCAILTRRSAGCHATSGFAARSASSRPPDA